MYLVCTPLYCFLQVVIFLLVDNSILQHEVSVMNVLYFWVSPPVAHGKSLEVEPYCIIGDVFVSKPDPVSNCRHIMARVTLSPTINSGESTNSDPSSDLKNA